MTSPRKKNWTDFLTRVIGWSGPAAATLSSVWTPADAAPLLASLPEAHPSHTRLQPITFIIPNRMEGPEIFIGHRSHSSHSSHRSHSSHYSGSGGYTAPSYSPPAATAPAYTPPPAYSPPPTVYRTPTKPVPTPTPAPAPRASQQDAILMTMRVQTVLTRLGFYTGKIDGKMGAETKAALRAFQRAQGLGVTGVMDNTTLAKLGIAG